MLGGIWLGWGVVVKLATGVHRLKFNIPDHHKKEHMSFTLANYCHIEQFKHMIRTKYTLRETGKLTLPRLLTATALDELMYHSVQTDGGILCPRRSGGNEAKVV